MDNTVVNRYLYKDNEPQQLDTNGFLRGRTIYRNSEYIISLDSYEQFRDIKNNPYNFILGNGGLGKSTYLSQIQNALSTENIPFCRINLRELSQEKTLTQKILPFCKSNKEISESFILLDALDEAIDIKITNPTAVIKDAIEECIKVNPNIKVILTCRDNRFPNELIHHFKRIFNTYNDNKYYLCNLTQENIINIASSLNCNNTNDFINKIIEYHLGNFASSPITLKPLILMYNNGDLNNNVNQYDLYDRLIKTLVEETTFRKNQHLNNMNNIKLSPVNDILLIASKIATDLKFQKKNYITTDKNDIDGIYIENLYNIKLFSERIPLTLTKDLLLEALKTKLFYKAGNIYTFSQQTYQDFLIAKYLFSLKLKNKDLLSLLKTDNVFHPFLTEAIAYLSIKNKEVFKNAIKNIPERLLLSTIYFSTIQQKKTLFKAYINCIKNDSISFWEYRQSRTFFNKKLYYYGIEKVLRKNLSNKDPLVCDTVVDFIGDNQLQTFEQDLKKLLFNKKTPINVKISIIQTCINSKYINLLKYITSNLKFFNSEFELDIHDQLRGTLLEALFPDYINDKQMLKLLTEPKDEHFFGRYDSFLTHKLSQNINSSNAVLYLTWIKENNIKNITRTMSNNKFPRNIHNIFKEISKIINFEIIDKILEIHLSIGYHHNYFSKDIIDAIEKDNNLRIYFLKNLILKTDNFTTFRTSNFYILDKIVKSSDIPIFLNLYLDTSFENKKEFIEYILKDSYRKFLFNKQIDDIEQIYTLINSNNNLSEKFKYYLLPTPISIDTGEPINERDLTSKNCYYENLKREERESKNKKVIPFYNNVPLQVNNHLRKRKSRYRKLETIFNIINLKKDSTNCITNRYSFDINEHPRWVELSEKQKNKVIQLSIDYLLNEDDNYTKCSDNYIKENLSLSCWRYFALLYDIKKINEPDYNRIINKWKEPIVFMSTWTDSSTKIKQLIIKDLFNQDKTCIFDILFKILLNSYRNGIRENFLKSFELIIDNDFLKKIFLFYSENEELLNDKIKLEILELLSSKNFLPIESYLKDSIKHCIKIEDTEKVGELLNILLYNIKGSWKFSKTIFNKSKKTIELLKILACRNARQTSYNNKSLLEVLNSSELVELYKLIIKNAPYVNKEQNPNANYIDHLYELQNNIVNYFIEQGKKVEYLKIKKYYLKHRGHKKGSYQKYYKKGLKNLEYNLYNKKDLNKDILMQIEYNKLKDKQFTFFQQIKYNISNVNNVNIEERSNL